LGSAIKEQIERQVSCIICLLYVQKWSFRVFLCLNKVRAVKAYEGVHQIRMSGELHPFHS
jgi:hypothetical protein